MSWEEMSEILENGIDVEVSQSIIDKSEPLCITNCPISLSFKGALSQYGSDICIATTSQRVTIYRDLTRRDDTFVFRPSEDISRRIIDYDDYTNITEGKMHPFTMNIKLIAENDNQEDSDGRFAEVKYDGKVVIKHLH